MDRKSVKPFENENKEFFFFDDKTNGVAMYVMRKDGDKNEALATFEFSVEEMERMVKQLKHRLKRIYSYRVDNL